MSQGPSRSYRGVTFIGHNEEGWDWHKTNEQTSGAVIISDSKAVGASFQKFTEIEFVERTATIPNQNLRNRLNRSANKQRRWDWLAFCPESATIRRPGALIDTNESWFSDSDDDTSSASGDELILPSLQAQIMEKESESLHKAVASKKPNTTSNNANVSSS